MSAGEARLDLRNATDEELQTGLQSERAQSYHDALSEMWREKQRQALKPFNPRVDVSADAKYLWRQVFIWFWLVPVAAVLLWLIAKSL